MLLCIHCYFNIMEHTTHLQSLKYSSYSRNTFTNHMISMKSLWTLKYSLVGCMFALLASLYIFFCCKCNNSADCKFWCIIRVTWIEFIYFEWYEFEMSTLYAYSLQWIINEYIVQFQYFWRIYIQNFMSLYE